MSETRQGRAEALARFERRTAVPMIVLALAIVPLLLIPVIWELSPAAERALFVLDVIVWAAFAIEYGIRLHLAPNRGRFVRRNVVDLLVIVLPFLRPLRVLRSARLLSAARGATYLGRALVGGKAILTHNKLHYALAITAFVVIAAALIVAAVEGDAAEANITSIPDALWWAVTTVTTVGYGDRFPVTPGGRAIAAVLMVLGIALFGFLAGSLASFFLERRGEEDVHPKLAEISDRLERVEKALGVGGSDPDGDQ